MVNVPVANMPVRPDFSMELFYCKKIIKDMKSGCELKRPMKFKLKTVDSGEAFLQNQLPANVVIIRQIPGHDTDNYWLAKLDEAIVRNDKKICYLIVCTVFEDEVLTCVGRKNIGLNVARIIDESILYDDFMDFEKAYHIGRCIADQIS